MFNLKIVFCCFLLVFTHVFGKYAGDTESNKTQMSTFCYFNGTNGFVNSLKNSELDANLCDYILVRSVLNPSNWTIRLARSNWEETILNDMSKLKAANNDLKFILSVYRNRQTNYFPLLAFKHYREFAANAKFFIRKYKFDGIHIDWWYPGMRSPVYEEEEEEDDDDDSNTSRPINGNHTENDSYEDDDNYIKEFDDHDENDEDDDTQGNDIERPGKKYFLRLIKELKSKLREDGTLIAVSVGAFTKNFTDGYDLDNLKGIVDYWFIMAMRYNLRYKSKILQGAPIRTNNPTLGVKASVDLVKKAIGPDYNKIVLTIPFYGTVFRLRLRLKENQTPFDNGIKSRSTTSSVVSYSAVCNFVKQIKQSNSTWTNKYNTTAEAPYLVKSKTVILYEDSRSVRAKVNLAIDEALGGIMPFNIDADDYKGSCSCKEIVKYPLLKTVHDTIYSPTSETWKTYQQCL